MVEIVYITREIILTNFSQKFFTTLVLWRHLYPKNALSEHLEQIFADFRLLLNYNMDFAHKIMMEIVHNT